MKLIYDPFEPTPEGFHRRVAQKLNEVQRTHTPVPRAYRRITVLAACLVLLCGTALALTHFGVLDFLTTRYVGSAEIDAEAVVTPTVQSCDSTLLTAAVQDAYWDGETLSVSVNVKPINDGYAFYMETDVGTDGEHFDQIWWNGTVQPLDDWLAGRQAIMLYIPEMTIDGVSAASAWDWVPDAQSETLLIQANAADMTHETELSIQLHSIIAGTGMAEQATLSVTLPAMAKEETRK